MLFIDARNYYTVVDRTLNEWSEWQLKNLNAIVWLYRNQTARYAMLIDHYEHSLMSIVIENLCQKTTGVIDNYLKRAILTVQITNVEQFGMKKFITTADPLILQTLSIISKKSLVFLEEVSNHLQLIDSSCHNRFAWKVQKEKIDEGYTSIFTAGNFEDFLKQGG